MVLRPRGEKERFRRKKKTQGGTGEDGIQRFFCHHEVGVQKKLPSSPAKGNAKAGRERPSEEGVGEKNSDKQGGDEKKIGKAASSLKNQGKRNR